MCSSTTNRLVLNIKLEEDFRLNVQTRHNLSSVTGWKFARSKGNE